MNIAGSANPSIDLDPIAVWGAVLSTILLLVRLWELWRNRSRIEIGYEFTNLPEMGNTITVRNLSATPITITFWQLQWRRCRWCQPNPERTINPEDLGDIIVASHASTKIRFYDANFFETTIRSLGKDRIYIRLNVAGRSRPVLKKVYQAN